MGYAHILALKTNGSLWSWGGGGSGETGDGLAPGTNRFTPLQIGTSTWKTIAAGRSISFGVKTDITLWGWGKNDIGQLGDGTTTNQLFPVQIGNANNWDSVSAGNKYAVGLKTDGSMWAWGDNYFGQLGNSTNTAETIPTEISVTGCTLANESFIVENKGLVVSPNPVQKMLTVENLDRNYSYIVCDLLGKEVIRGEVSRNENIINFESLAIGMYLMKLKDAAGAITNKKIFKD